jgi:hypothetical protein
MMKSTIMLAVIVVAGMFGLLFAARSFRRLCQGRFLSAAAAFLLMAILFALVAVFCTFLTSHAKMKPVSNSKSSQIEQKTGTPQQTSAGDSLIRGARTPEKEREMRSEELEESHRQYLMREAPARSNLFSDMAFALDMYSRSVSLTESNVLHYLGQPDIPPPVPKGSDIRFEFSDYTYFHDRFGLNDWAVHICFSSGVVDSVGYRPTHAHDFRMVRRLRNFLDEGKKGSPKASEAIGAEAAPQPQR